MPILPNLHSLTFTCGEIGERVLGFIYQSRQSLKTLDMGGAANTEISEGAFYRFKNLETVVLPRSLERTGYGAFSE